MARCPHCNYKFQLIDVKAECPICGVNVPNYNWEERLEEDAINAEKSFVGFRKKTKAFKSCLFGNKLRIARFVFTFVPLVFFLIPMFVVNVNLPFSDGVEAVSLLNIILGIVDGSYNLGAMLTFTSLEASGTAFLMLYISLVLVLLGIVAAVLNFFVLLISGFSYHAKGNMICCITSIVLFLAAVVLVIVSGSMLSAAIPEIMSLRISAGLFVAIALFALNLTMNTITRKQFKAERAEAYKEEIDELTKKDKEAQTA